MATNSLRAESACDNSQPAPAAPAQQIYDRAIELQRLCSRIRSLARAVDAVADDLHTGPGMDPAYREAISSVTNFTDLIEREAADGAEAGGSIELLALALKSGA